MPVITLKNTVNSWASSAFEDTFRNEVLALNCEQLPLQQGLTQSSYVSDSGFNVVILNSFETTTAIHVKAGIFYAGIIAGSCCSDDPTPMNEEAEYCEVEFDIDKSSAETKMTLLSV